MSVTTTPPARTPPTAPSHAPAARTPCTPPPACTCGEESVTAGPGAFLWLPRDVPHRLRFETECHLLQIAIPAGLEVFHKKMGQPAPRIELPPPGQVLDKEKYRRLASEHGLEIIELPQWDKKEEAKRVRSSR